MMIRLRVIANVQSMYSGGDGPPQKEVDFGVIIAPSELAGHEQSLRNWGSNYIRWCTDHNKNGIMSVYDREFAIVWLNRVEIAA
jgi:hypothetical protein